MGEKQSARVFLAVAISAEVADAVAGLQSTLGRAAPAGIFRFVDAQQAHVTLRFLGQRTPDEQERAARAATAAAAGTAAFALAFGALGVFPDERRPHTLWMGLTEGRREMTDLATRLEKELLAVGFAAEERPYAPHLTIARVKQRPPPHLMRNMLTAPAHETPVQPVESFALMESRPSGAGVRYVPLCTFRLENPCTPSK